MPATDTLPHTIPAKGLPADRQEYLYEKVRRFCYNAAAKEATCPEPSD